MTDSQGATGYGATGAGTGAGSGQESGTGSAAGAVDTAKHEASEVKDTAAHEAGRVADTAKSEVKSVASEAKSQAKDLYHQSTRQLKDQAATQQDRVAKGLRSVGDELDSLANGSDQQGLGADLVRQASQRVSSAASWLGDRDPASVLDEVKSFARRKPGTFIAIAAVAGLAIGRLTRALAEGAKEQRDAGDAASTVGDAPLHATDPVGTGTGADGYGTPGYGTPGYGTPGYGTADPLGDAVVDPFRDGTPVYDDSRAARRTGGIGGTGAGSGDVRPDSF